MPSCDAKAKVTFNKKSYAAERASSTRTIVIFVLKLIVNASMAAITALTAATAATAAVAYLDAKFHIEKDLKKIMRQIWANGIYSNAAKKKQLSPWYLFEAQVLKDPQADCIWSQAGCYTRIEVYEQCCRYANWFLSQGVEPGQWVAVYLQNCAEFMFIWVALWSIGCAPALLNYNLGGESLIHVLKNSGSSLVVVDPEIPEDFNKLRDMIEGVLKMRIVLLEDAVKHRISHMEPKRPEDSHRANVKGHDNQALIYTSGTSGKPKGVPHIVHHAYLYGVNGVEGLEVGSNHRWYQCMPMYHGTGGMVSIICPMSGTPLCIGKKFSVSQFWEDIRASRSTCFTYVGETVRYLLVTPPSASDQDHSVTSMFGNGLRPDVWKKFRDRFGVSTVVEFFGSSEGVFALRNCCKGDYLVGAVGHHGLLTRQMMQNKYVPVVVDTATGELVRSSDTGFVRRQPYDVGGEMLVRINSESEFPGYFQNPVATGKKFARDVFSKGDLWYRTGDALRRTSDGRWLFLDRLGDTYRWKSENVSTAEVSEILGHYTGILEAIVYGVLVPTHEGRAGCAALVIDQIAQDTFDFVDFHRYAQSRLPRYAVPIFLRVGKSFLHTDNNKQNKVILRKQGVDLRKVGPSDTIMWSKPGAQGYFPLTAEDWIKIDRGQVKL